LPRQEVAIVAKLGESPLLEVVLDAVRILAGRIADSDHRLGARVFEAELEGRARARELCLLSRRQEIVLLEFVGEDHRPLALRIDIDQREMAVLLGLDREHRKVVHLVVGLVQVRARSKSWVSSLVLPPTFATAAGAAISIVSLSDTLTIRSLNSASRISRGSTPCSRLRLICPASPPASASPLAKASAARPYSAAAILRSIDFS